MVVIIELKSVISNKILIETFLHDREEARYFLRSIFVNIFGLIMNESVSYVNIPTAIFDLILPIANGCFGMSKILC